MAVFGEYRHFHSSVGVMTPCMSSSTQDTERLWIPPPQEVEQAVQGLLSHLRLKIKKASDESDGDRLMCLIRDVPGQRVVQVVRHDLLVAVTRKQTNENN